MSAINYGNQFDVQSVGTPAVYTYTASGTIATTTYPSTSTNVVPGLSFGTPISGTNPASGIANFLIPTDFSSTCDFFQVIHAGSAGAVVAVSGVSPQTINGLTAEVTITRNSGKSFYNVSGSNWIAY